MESLVPRHQLGYVLPIPVGDYIHYQFYRAVPKNVFMVAIPLALQSFSAGGAEAAMQGFMQSVDFLHKRGVDRIVQGGIPISAFIGRPRMLDLCAEAERRTGIPCSADFEETIEGLQHLGVKRIAIAAKWDEALINAMRTYLGHAGIDVVGSSSEVHTAQQVMDVTPQDGLDMAVRLGADALQKFGEAEGLLLGGGAWLSMPAVPVLEERFGKPVVTNPTATYWAAMRQFGVSGSRGFGRLLDSL
jgi:arylmalonate decarboxylase